MLEAHLRRRDRGKGLSLAHGLGMPVPVIGPIDLWLGASSRIDLLGILFGGLLLDLLSALARLLFLVELGLEPRSQTTLLLSTVFLLTFLLHLIAFDQSKLILYLQ